MRIQVYTVGELQSLVESKYFSQLTNVPISPLRAISQHHNPKAQTSDPALIVANNDQDEIIAYAGLYLPTIVT